MTRFFVRPDQISNGLVTLDADDALHLARVLRANVGDKIDILDSSGLVYYCALSQLSKFTAIATVENSEPCLTEPAVKVTVAQALPKTSEKLEWVLQHGVEAGAAEFWMFRSRRSEAGKLAEKPDRWEKIVKTAAEQSGRAILPKALSAGTFDTVLSRANEFDLALLCDENPSAKPLKTVLNTSPKSVLICVGPEGGWDDAERQAATSAGMCPVSLGRRTLRTETAALIALAQVLYSLDAG